MSNCQGIRIMDIKEQLFKEQSKVRVMKIRDYIGNDSRKFSELMDLFFSNDDWRLNQKAAWVLGHCMDQHPNMIVPYIPKLIQNLSNKVPDAVKRNTVRCLQDVDIPEDYLGEVAEICFNYLNSSEEPVAVKVFSMTVLANICLKFPELKNELIPTIEQQLPYSSAGFKSRAKKVFKQLGHI